MPMLSVLRIQTLDQSRKTRWQGIIAKAPDMTLDTLTRAHAESNHVRLQNSLAQSCHEFREQFMNDTLLFRSLPSSIERRPSTATESHAAKSPRREDLDLVRGERVRQCCKRVRVWRRLAANPLLQYKQQQLAASKLGNGKKNDRRMHTTMLMTLIVDVYEQLLAAEVDSSSNRLASTQSLPIATSSYHESLPESVTRYVSQRAVNRRIAGEQLHGVVATVLHASSAGQRRVHLFGVLCGLLPNPTMPALSGSDGDAHGTYDTAGTMFNPPERVQMFLRVLACLHRCKLSTTPGNARLVDDFASSSTMVDVVFHHAGISQHAAQKVVTELFREDFYWNLRFWHAPSRELGVNYDWPPGASEELQSRAVALAASSRNALLNASRKIDTDAFLELLVCAWTQRAREVHAMLDAATDKEERDGISALLRREQEQLSRFQHRPVTEKEREVFAQLVEEFWNAAVPWCSARIQSRLAQAADPDVPRRPTDEIRELYAAYVSALDAPQRPWDWQSWRWDADWDWGSLLLSDQVEAAGMNV